MTYHLLENNVVSWSDLWLSCTAVRIPHKSIENVPPTQAALAQHIKRAANQACHIWGQALEPMQELPSPLRQSGFGSNHRKVGLPSGLC